jgi:hypothetical protein
MKLSKTFMMVSMVLIVVWTAGSVQGNDLVPLKWLPGDIFGKARNSTGTYVDLFYTFGPTTPHIYFGYDNAKDSDAWKIRDNQNTWMMYGASIDYKVSDAFYVIPVFTFYDWGKQPGVTYKPDIGKEWIGGLKLRFVF